MAINKEISGYSETYRTDDTLETISIESERARLDQERLRQRANAEKKNIEEQAKLEAVLRKRGLEAHMKEYKKAMLDANKKVAKQQQIDELKFLQELYEEKGKLEEDFRKQQYATNEAILKSRDSSLEQKTQAFVENLGSNAAQGLNRALNQTLNALTGQLNTLMEFYASYQSKVNARIQGAGKTYASMENLMTSAIGVQPYIKNQTMVQNLADLVDSGIAYNVELRAFIQTMKDNIATTFDATNGTLLRLIRLQQSDSTAARLGLEASLTRYFNSMYQNTEYLSNSFDTVASALIEASSTMGNDRAIQFEYQVQKWLGSLYGVGMSDETISGLAQAIGYLGSGNISALSGSKFQNLLVMAAARAGMSYSDLLIRGLDSSSTNTLLQSMVEYLKEIAGGTNQVVKSQLGEVFGVNISDLTAALNLNTSTIRNISGKSMNYASSIGELMYQMQMMPGRMSSAVMLDNLWSNLMWGLSSNVAANPMLYAMWKVTDMIQQHTGGINIPTIGGWAMGSGTQIDLETTVENLIKLGIVGVSSLGMIGDLVSGLTSSALPASMLFKMGFSQSIGNLTSLGGRGLNAAVSGLSTSSTVFAGNAEGSDIYQAALGDEQGKAQQQAETQKPEVEDYTEHIDEQVTYIYELLTELTNGSKQISVRADNIY